MAEKSSKFFLVFLFLITLQDFQKSKLQASPITDLSRCPKVKAMSEFNIFAMLGEWFVALYYSSSEETLTYHCMRVEFGLSRGNMDMRMRMRYRYANDPEDEVQTGNMTWQIPDPRRPEHWRHTEDNYRGIYNTYVIDTDYTTWLLLLHCSDPQPNKKYLSAFVFSRKPVLDKMTIAYLVEKLGGYTIELEYLFPVNQTECLSDLEREAMILESQAKERENDQVATTVDKDSKEEYEDEDLSGQVNPPIHEDDL